MILPSVFSSRCPLNSDFPVTNDPSPATLLDLASRRHGTGVLSAPVDGSRCTPVQRCQARTMPSGRAVLSIPGPPRSRALSASPRAAMRYYGGYTRGLPGQTHCAGNCALEEIRSRIGTTTSVVELERGRILRS